MGQGGASGGGLAEDFGVGAAGENAEGFGGGFEPGLERGKGPCQGVYFRHLFACLIVARWGGSVKGEVVCGSQRYRDLCVMDRRLWLQPHQMGPNFE